MLCFISNAIFSTQPQCCLTFSRIELQVLVFCTFLKISHRMMTWMKKTNDFQIAKVWPQGVAQFLLDVLPISA